MGRFPISFGPNGKGDVQGHDTTYESCVACTKAWPLDLIRVRAGCFLFSPAAWAGGQMLAYSSPHNSLSLSLLWAAILLAAG